jgi:hypothetical protein
MQASDVNEIPPMYFNSIVLDHYTRTYVIDTLPHEPLHNPDATLCTHPASLLRIHIAQTSLGNVCAILPRLLDPSTLSSHRVLQAWIPATCLQILTAGVHAQSS